MTSAEPDRTDAETDRRFSLSPSRASDFLACPLRYRLRHLDGLPEPPGLEAYRGTLVHAVLEHLFDLPARDRTLQRAAEALEPVWVQMLAEEGPELPDLLFGPPENWLLHLARQPLLPHDRALTQEFLAGARKRLATYFTLEDPTRLQPAERELAVSASLPGGLQLRGYVDRLDRASDGRTRVVDYKTGRSPAAAFEQRAMFQLRCYGLALWRSQGVAPTVLQLLYLGDGQVLSYVPDEDDLLATERKLGALWRAILRAYELSDWPPRTSGLCNYCSFRELCPAWGGTVPAAPGQSTATVEG